MFKKITPIFLGALFLAAGLWAKTEIKYLAQSDVRLRQKASNFSSNFGVLVKGQKVIILGKSAAYYKVSVIPEPGQKLKRTIGYINMRSLSTSKPKIASTIKRRWDSSSEEVAAATKGFNASVEAQVRQGNAKLDFDQLDLLLKRTTMESPQTALDEWRKAGKLGEYQPGANSEAAND